MKEEESTGFKLPSKVLGVNVSTIGWYAILMVLGFSGWNVYSWLG